MTMAIDEIKLQIRLTLSDLQAAGSLLRRATDRTGAMAFASQHDGEWADDVTALLETLAHKAQQFKGWVEPAPQTLDYTPKLDRVRRPDNPRQWAYQLMAATPDRTTARSLEKFAPPIKDQAAEGSCTAHGGTSAAETCEAIAGGTVVPLCRNELYFDERTDEGDFPQDAGASVADSIDSQLRRNGLHAESTWPYDARPSEKPPAAQANTPRYLYVSGHQPIDLSTLDMAINGILTAFDAKKPIVIGLDWYQEFFTQFQSTGVLAAKPTSQVAGGHEVFSACVYVPPNPAKRETGQYGLIGYDNSWGLTSPARTDLHPDARAGMVFIPLEAHGKYVSEVRAVVGASQPAPTPGPTPTPTPNCTAVVDAEFLSLDQQCDAAIAQMPSAATFYTQGKEFVDWSQHSVDQALAGKAERRALPLPRGH